MATKKRRSEKTPTKPRYKSKSGRSKAEITAAGRKQTKKVYKREMAKEAEMGGRIKRHVVSSVKEPVGEFVKNVKETKDLFVSQHKPTRLAKLLRKAAKAKSRAK